MTPNIREFISYHNDHILDAGLTASLEAISSFALKKNIALEDLSIEKHRLPFINWLISLPSSKI